MMSVSESGLTRPRPHAKNRGVVSRRGHYPRLAAGTIGPKAYEQYIRARIVKVRGRPMLYRDPVTKMWQLASIIPACFLPVAPSALSQTHKMFVASMSLRVRHNKRSEALSAFDQLMRQMRAWPGCLRCQLLADIDDDDALNLTPEWRSREALEGLLSSQEFLVLQGMRMLLDREPQTVVDEVVARATLAFGKPREKAEGA
jgi:quinol monooxygenase YgiN